MNKYDLNQTKVRQRYSSQFKGQTIERAKKEGVSQVAKDLGIKSFMIYSGEHKSHKRNVT